MSKRNGKRKVENGKLEDVESSTEKQTSFWRNSGKIERYFAGGIITLLAVGVFGAASSNLNLFTESPKPQVSSPKSETQSIEAQNAATSQPTSPTNATVTSATPTLSKEYLYAGSRILAVSDANAEAAPPADLAVWRPSTGTWYVLGNGGSVGNTVLQWGTNGDKPAPGDYDGDGKTDFSIFRPSNGEWWIRKSSDGTSYAMQFGLLCPPNSSAPCDQTAQADYDGDGKTDAAIYRPSDGTWYILPSSGGSYFGIQFGLPTDVPAPADYDGDGKADAGVWRNSTNVFYSRNSSNGALSYSQIVPPSNVTLEPQSLPVSGDYDGDGRVDYAIRNGNNWIIKKSGDGTTYAVAWQTAGDEAVQNDYDGDGKVDIAVWRNADGMWFIKQSSNNVTRQVQWGTNGDKPVPVYYRVSKSTASGGVVVEEEEQ